MVTAYHRRLENGVLPFFVMGLGQGSDPWSDP